MSDQQFADLCAEQPDLFFEMTAAGDLIVMPPRLSSQSFWHLCPDFVIDFALKRTVYRRCEPRGASGWKMAHKPLG
jgi:hypothetical protein